MLIKHADRLCLQELERRSGCPELPASTERAAVPPTLALRPPEWRWRGSVPLHRGSALHGGRSSLASGASRTAFGDFRLLVSRSSPRRPAHPSTGSETPRISRGFAAAGPLESHTHGSMGWLGKA